MSPVDILTKYHPILKRFTVGFNYELLLNRVKVVEAFQPVYTVGAKATQMYIILYGRV